MAHVSADSFGDDRYDGGYPYDYSSPYDQHSYDSPRIGHPRRQHPDAYDDHHELLDDDLPLDTFDSHSLMDKIKHLKRLQGQGECPDDHDQHRGHGSMYPRGRGSYRGGYGGRGSGHPLGDMSDLPPSSGDSGKGAGSSKGLKSKPPAKDTSDSTDNTEKDEGDKKGDSGEYDFDSDQNTGDDGGYGYEFGRVRGLSNQIEHVKQLRRLPPFKDLKAK